jgi:hypothetical protein
MLKRRVLLLVVVLLVACPTDLLLRGTSDRVAFAAVPQRLTDAEFWKLIADLSEPNGSLPFDNLVSNEIFFQHVIPDLVFRSKAGRAYVGVGPEQNFTYIAALKPSIAFILDLRRENLNLHLLYKALFEMSVDRAQFVSLLFSRPMPDRLARAATAKEMFAAFAKIQSSEAHYQKNLKAVTDRLTKTHGFALTHEDLQAIESAYKAFYQFGPRLRYSSTGNRGGSRVPSYQDLMTATDDEGEERSYLAGDQEFAVVKNLQARNLIVPLVGNFAGPKTIRAVGQYLKAKGALVSAFYLSNVEQYLSQDKLLGDFCANAATLPLDASSMFIRSRHFAPPPAEAYRRRIPGFQSELGIMAEEVKDCPPPSAR